jgi:hypothetical protein
MKPDRQLIWFLEHLYQFHSHVIYGFNNVRPDEAQARCQRWMDAVLPPEPKPEHKLPLAERPEVEIPY